MKTQFLRLLTALPLTAVLGCDTGALPTDTTDDTVQAAQVAQEAAAGFVFDSTAIATPPSGTLPTTLLARTAFDDAMLQRALVGTTEPFTQAGATGSRRDLESQSWTLETNPTAGRVLVLSKVDSGPATPQEPAVLQRTALARLQRWGIPAAEMGPIRQMQSFSQGEDNGVLAAPVLHGHKTFVLRAINGIRVEGHRAVVTHGPDGNFRRALVSWPPLARSGHLLRTRLTTADIEQRAREALRLEGETGGPVTLFWKYVPTQTSTGEWVLTLEVGAAMDARPGESATEEPIIVDVDVSPVP
jgi:hypothetical protein